MNISTLMPVNLLSPLTIRNLTLSNRIAVSSMCQYSSTDGYANDWHLVHLGSRAVGGAALVMTEAAAVLPEARISRQDLGVWKDDHVHFLRHIVDFLHEQGSAAGIQLAHAGRKASTRRPWEGEGAIPLGQGGWTEVLAPSAVPFSSNYPQPREMTLRDIKDAITAFAEAARRAREAGFDIVEIHAAHGYLVHEFLSPLSNLRKDEYGGSFENRTRLLREIVKRVRIEWPDGSPLFVRISATDWVEGGWDAEQSVELARQLKTFGVDLIDCSTGGNVANANIPVGPGYQVKFAERIRSEAGILTGAVGMITEPSQADEIISGGKADIVLLAREMLRDPYWSLRAAKELNQTTSWPVQYLRAAPKESPKRAPSHCAEVEELQRQ
ncbi:MAG: NADH:flavin oxidoreductase/NADH oxidase [Terriglobales bacterium]